MMKRYEGENGKRLLVEALRRQILIEGNVELAAQIGEVARIKEYESGAALVEQDGEDNHIVFLLTGSVSIIVNGREVNHRIAGQHVGEMALIDPKARRAASVIAMETSVVAEIPEAEFSQIADANPRVWRLIAMELGERLRQRNDLVLPRNQIPTLFVASSVESLAVANEVQAALDHDPIVVKIWTDGVFGASHFAIDDLQAQVKSADFALIVMSADDRVISREKENDAPRDNVVFELGMFMGAYPRERTLLLVPRGAGLKIPTDLLGLKSLEYNAADPANLRSNLGPACLEIRKRITELGPR